MWNTDVGDRGEDAGVGGGGEGVKESYTALVGTRGTYQLVSQRA